MLDHLRSYRSQIERHQATLESQVAERTSELKQRNSELRETLQILKDTQVQLIHSEKMASLGHLVAGIAHELNNPMNYISGNIDALRGHHEVMVKLIDLAENLPSLSPEDRVRLAEAMRESDYPYTKRDLAPLLASMRHGAEKIRRVIAELRSFSRLDEAEWKEVDLSEGLHSALTLLAHEIEGRIAVHLDIPFAPVTYCNPSQINQVFMHVLRNAVQAIAACGNLYISCRKEPSGYAVSIRDDGIGIDRAVLPKVFDPFFTTREIGKGTGLGLTVAYGIIKQHGGSITVDSDGQNGTTVTLHIPLAEQPSTPLRFEESELGEGAGGV